MSGSIAKDMESNFANLNNIREEQYPYSYTWTNNNERRKAIPPISPPNT